MPRWSAPLAMLATLWALAFTASGQDGEFDLEKDFEKNSQRAVGRDSFPVFDHPEMLTPEEAENKKIVLAGDLVIGIAAGDEAKAYPLPVMGTVELGNDSIGGIPVTVSW